jgi:hypothetical protein
MIAALLFHTRFKGSSKGRRQNTNRSARPIDRKDGKRLGAEICKSKDRRNGSCGGSETPADIHTTKKSLFELVQAPLRRHGVAP